MLSKRRWRKRLRTHGFRNRTTSVIKSRRRKGRYKLTPAGKAK